NSGDLSVLRVGPDGRLAPIPGSPFNRGYNTHSLDVHPSRRELAIGDAAYGSVRGVDILAGGGLSDVVSSGTGPAFGVRFTPDGSRIYGAGYYDVFGVDALAG